VQHGLDESIGGHLVVYAVLAALVAWALRGAGLSLGRTLVVVWTVAVLYGLTHEFHPSFVPNRKRDVRDVLTDVIGAAVALAVVR